MSFKSEITAARLDLGSVKDDCLKLVTQTEQSLEAAPSHQEVIRLMAVPILYSAWERLFTISNAIRIRLLQRRARNCAAYPVVQRVPWLFQEPFFQRFQSKCNQRELSHLSLEAFLGDMEKWMELPVNKNLDPDKLTFTKSNVNREIVVLNARLFGLDSEPKFLDLDLSKLDELVGRRNAIGHGGTIKPPGPLEFSQLVDYVKYLIKEYSRLIAISLRRI